MTLKRSLFFSVSLALLASLSACQSPDKRDSTRHLKPISAKLNSTLDQKGLNKTSPMLVRIFKQEAELEVWKQSTNGHYVLLKTYPICKWSGELGPKVKEGDRQAPEGFYTVTPAQMNPKSQYYLAFNMGFPNKFDSSYGRYGSHLMVHGDCSSRGCYAMTDEAMADIYALARDSFEGGQRSFQVQAYPFRMTAKNMARHRDNPNMPFWKNLKEGNDHFEVTKQEPKIEVCERKYVFNPTFIEPVATPVQMQMKNSSLDPWKGLAGAKIASSEPSKVIEATPALMSRTFNAAEKCPSYTVQSDVLEQVNIKRLRDEKEMAHFSSQGLTTIPAKTGLDGGMHRLYATKENMPHLDRMALLHEAKMPTLSNDFKSEKPTALGALFGKKAPIVAAQLPQEEQKPVIIAPLPQSKPQ